MPSPDAKLMLFAFPQRWAGGKLSVRMLVLPRGNPLQPLDGTTVAFADATPKFDAVILPGTQKLPDPAATGTRTALADPVWPRKRAIFDQFAASFEVKPAPATPPALPTGTAFRKYLTESYRRAFAFAGTRTPYAVTDESYRCAITQATPAQPTAPPSRELSWGQIYSFLLRQPKLAEEAGLVHGATFDVDDPGTLADGGWLYLDLRPGSVYADELAAAPGALAHFAARLPPVPANGSRPLFGAVQFPVVPPPPPGPTEDYDQAAEEAIVYDDGFAKIVHGWQPRTGEVVDGVATTPLGKDLGIRLGWDDEQTVIWMNRQIKPDPGDPTRPEVDVPMGVAGYRIDVREHGTQAWHTLMRARGPVVVGAMDLGVFDGELSAEAVPVQLEGKKTGDFWLPSFFTTWRGASLVFPDSDEFLLAGYGDVQQASALKPIDDRVVPLRYGREYDFRVRLRDLTGGGPDPGDEAHNPGPAPETTIEFRRFVPPQQVVVADVPELAPGATALTLRVFRPRLAYPAACYTEMPGARAALLADVPTAKAQRREPAIADPDVRWVEVAVEADGVALYRTLRAFPNDPEAALRLPLSYRDIPDIAGLVRTGPPVEEQGPLVLPTAREVRLDLVAVARQDDGLDYFGDQSARRGPQAVHIDLRAPSRDERGLLDDASALKAIYLQPEPSTPDTVAGDVVGMLAQELSLASTGLTLQGRPGHRTQFGCASELRHVLSPDGTELTIAARPDLTRRWILALRLALKRDRTWDGLAANGFEILRDGVPAGNVSVPRYRTEDADPASTDLVFLDAIDPTPEPGGFPDELTVTYEVRPHFRHPPKHTDPPRTWTIRLPVATAPTQVPRLTSAGIAATPYAPAPDYASTEHRRRHLWLEFEEPPRDPRDRYYARVLAYAPDPMLLSRRTDVPDPIEPPLPIAPEPIRVVVPNQSDDGAGLGAMQELIASGTSSRHYLLPLPPGLTEDSLELLGFFTYEIRVGHDAQRWCTAQGRYGPPQRVSGVQHPAPALTPQVTRSATAVSVAAPYAMPVLGGRPVRPAWPHTELWALLYARVRQADRAEHRNVLIGRAKAMPRQTGDQTLAQTEQTYGTGSFEEDDIRLALDRIGMPRHTPLGVLVVELLAEAEHDDALRSDPLGENLGQVRIIRTSPLRPVPSIC